MSSVFPVSCLPSSLPTEILDLILEDCSQSTLLTVSLASRRLCCVAQRLIFRKVDVKGVRNAIKLSRVLLASPHLAAHVKDLYVTLESEDQLFYSFWTLLGDVLVRMHNIDALHFGPFSLSDVVLKRCTFPKLKSFTSITYTSNELAVFLQRHPCLEQVFIGAETDWEIDENEPLTLSDSSLPILRSFIGSRSMGTRIVPGRPISELTVVWLTSLTVDETDVVVESFSKGSVPLQHFSCTSLHIAGNRYSILESLSSHMPQLETLRVNNFSIAGTLDQLFMMIIDIILPRFKQLRALHVPSIVNAVRAGQTYGPDAKETDAEVLKGWHKLCPTLEFATLPSCVEWIYHREDKTWRDGGNFVIPAFTTARRSNERDGFLVH